MYDDVSLEAHSTDFSDEVKVRDLVCRMADEIIRLREDLERLDRKFTYGPNDDTDF
jgi:hypothetical protein